MRQGLLRKSWRETRVSLLIFALALFAVEALVSFILPTFRDELASTWLGVGFVKNILRALLGTEIGDSFGPDVFLAIPWVHPVVLSIVWAQEVTFCTRVPAGEIDRGTIDVLLGLPISRRELWLAETAVWLLSGGVLALVATAGFLTGTGLADPESIPSASRMLPVLANFGSLYLAVGGMAFLVSALSSRKGQAVGWVFGLLLASFLVNFLTLVWEVAESFSFLSLLTYYRPIEALRGAGWPLGDMAILTGLGVACWIAGRQVFRRRDIYTV